MCIVDTKFKFHNIWKTLSQSFSSLHIISEKENEHDNSMLIIIYALNKMAIWDRLLILIVKELIDEFHDIFIF